MDIKHLLRKKYNYGGKLVMLGDIIIDLKKKTPSQACIDKYIQGLLLSQEPKN